jgi:hypothetical protein
MLSSMFRDHRAMPTLTNLSLNLISYIHLSSLLDTKWKSTGLSSNIQLLLNGAGFLAVSKPFINMQIANIFLLVITERVNVWNPKFKWSDRVPLRQNH